MSSTPDPGASGRKSVVSMRDMVERFRTAPPLPRDEREKAADGMVLWWKTGAPGAGINGTSPPPQLSSSLQSNTSIGDYRARTASNLLDANGAAIDNGALDDFSTEALP